MMQIDAHGLKGS